MQPLAVNGSPHKDGRLAIMLAKLEVPTAHLSDGIEGAYQAILKSDPVVFATPVMWFNMSALMKELLERIPESEEDFPCYDKTAYFFAMCDEDGAQQTIGLMMSATNHMGFSIPRHASYIYNNKMADKSENLWQLKAIDELKNRLVDSNYTTRPSLLEK
ncbi:MAG: NADPH-dependent FMN reductase [Parcubacteria group bacterium GW2011_GWA2_51_10]|nr:MAG: NADPH-dependent FMN reductase [Parcubacteria group bacterium GW2011_GWA2_51_10]